MDEKKLLNEIDKKFESQAQLINIGFQSVTDQINNHKRDTDERFERIDERFESLEAAIKFQFDKVHEEIADIKERLKSLDQRTHEEVTDLYRRVGILEGKFQELEKQSA